MWLMALGVEIQESENTPPVCTINVHNSPPLLATTIPGGILRPYAWLCPKSSWEMQLVGSTPLWSAGGAPAPQYIMRAGYTSIEIDPTRRPRRCWAVKSVNLRVLSMHFHGRRNQGCSGYPRVMGSDICNGSVLRICRAEGSAHPIL